jgi:hypothetical protein
MGRQHSQPNYIPPDEYESAHYAQIQASPAGDASTMKPV